MEAEKGWMYNSETVAKIQLFFGLECVPVADIQDEPPQPNSNNKKPHNGQSNGVTHRPVSPQHDVSSQSLQGPGSSGESRRLGDPNATVSAAPVEYRVHNKFWHYLFAFGAALGDDIFYYTVFPFWFFNISPWVIRRVILMWGLLMYVGQASKEIIRWPRPLSPPVAPLERRYYQEYGMPSTHAMVGTLVPFTVLIVTWGKVEYPKEVGVLLAISYTLLVCMSRLYKGMHYILDIFGGIFITALLMAIVFQFLEPLDTFLITHPYAPLFSMATAFFLSIIYPTQDGWSSTRADTIVIMGVTTGIYSSLWLCHQQGIPPMYDELPSPHIKWPGPYSILLMLCRQVIGLALMGLSHVTFKTIILGILSAINGEKITEETKKQTWIEIPYKYITYFAICVALNYLSPLVFEKVGL
ncbi:sphingosine-1-phosphate phosphatase 2 [Strongylocentrotus purpuratus]|uniref:Phosphatidic acid phosphatase type 2/haloperoxidase domain-containing protein n=1 Tax=Strongylocentrotus purpuratus TaxID=7668 RepID=A0A7M7RCG9_STRPU|nr:sphingosine-1-phosphate phosphatase 2 [Strongylocentrotus purpuratus]